MASEALELIPYALIAAASPLGLAATLTVLRTGRAQALRVAAGVVVGQLLACGVLVAIGVIIVQPQRAKRPYVEMALEVGLGVALLVTAAGLDVPGEGLLVLWYSVLATAVVWVPVVAAVIVGQPALDGVEGALQWLARHRRPVTFYSSLVISIFLIAHGLLLLVGQA